MTGKWRERPGSPNVPEAFTGASTRGHRGPVVATCELLGAGATRLGACGASDETLAQPDGELSRGSVR
ncbi:hypothetical protein GCM10010488_25690 [Oerskovia jenensis]